MNKNTVKIEKSENVVKILVRDARTGRFVSKKASVKGSVNRKTKVMTVKQVIARDPKTGKFLPPPKVASLKMPVAMVSVTISNLLTATVKSGDVFRHEGRLYRVNNIQHSALAPLERGVNCKLFDKHVVCEGITEGGQKTGEYCEFNQAAPYSTMVRATR